MGKYVVIKELLNIRNYPAIKDETFIGTLQMGDEIDLLDEPIVGDTPIGTDDNVWHGDSMNRYVSRPGVAPKESYAAKKAAFIKDKFNEPFINIQDVENENSWKISWANVDLDIWKIWRDLNATGKDINVAILDSGINTKITGLIDAIKDKDLDMKSFVPNESIEDDIGHGTHCASIIGARGSELFGVAPNCNLIVGKVESKNFGKNSKVILTALKWACEERNADVVSMSFSVPAKSAIPVSPEEKEIADYILKMHTEKNKIFVCAIGNLGDKAKELYAYPANYEGCISIGGYDHDRSLLQVSSWNKKLSFVVPGIDLKAYNLSGIKILLPQATSYACPCAAGILANLICYFKNQNIKFVAKDLLSNLIFDLPPENNLLKYGFGIINCIESFKK